MNIHLEIEHSREIDEWIRQHHYLGTVPAGAVLRMRFIDDVTGETIGGMLWGRNPSPKQDQYNQLCLTRMYFVDNTEHYIESHALSMARKYIRKHMPKIKGVVAYSSTGVGHEGIVYQADGWVNVSTTKSGCRDCRDGRKNVDTSAKIKWVRTP